MLGKGQNLKAAEIGLLATLGIMKITTLRKPVVGIFSSGNELVDPFSQSVEKGKIRDSNKAMLTAMLEATNTCTVTDLGKMEDSEEAVQKHFSKLLATESVDIIVTTGGVSMGDLDLIKPYLHKHGKILFGRLNMKPGKPTTFAKLGNKCLVFALPGNPTSAYVTARMFLPLAISCVSGDTP